MANADVKAEMAAAAAETHLEYLTEVHGDRTNVPKNVFDTFVSLYHKLGDWLDRIQQANGYKQEQRPEAAKKGG